MNLTKDTLNTDETHKYRLTGTIAERCAKLSQICHEYYPNLEILSPYINASTNMKFHCKRCDSTFMRKPYTMLQPSTRTKYGCKKCNTQARTQNKAISLSEALERLHKLFPDIQYISGYTNYHSKAHFKCLKCGKEFNRSWGRFTIAKDGCPYCIHHHWGNNRRKDPNEYEKEFNIKFPNLTLLTPYVSSRRMITVKCNNCGNIWKTKPLTLLRQKYGCNICASKHTGTASRKTLMSFWHELKRVNQDVYIRDKYQGNKVSINVQCKVCSFIWVARPIDLLTGRSRCPQCGLAKHTYERANFCKKYRKVCNKQENESYQHYNQHAFVYCVMQKHPKIRLMSIFKDMNSFVRIKCLRCGRTNYLKADNLLRGFACPMCDRTGSNISKGEQTIASLLSQAGIYYEYPFIPYVLTDKGALHYDFRVYGKYLIEYQGRQHYQAVAYFGGETTFERQQQHDQMKRKWAKDNGFILIEIKYDDPIKEKLVQYFPKVSKCEPNIKYKIDKQHAKFSSSVHLGEDLFGKFNEVKNSLSFNMMLHLSLITIRKHGLKIVHYKYIHACSTNNSHIKTFSLSSDEYTFLKQYRDQFDSISDQIRSLLYTYYLYKTHS